MKTFSLTQQEVVALYEKLNLSFEPIENIDFNKPYEAITNRNFGIKDYTISTNNTNFTKQNLNCLTDENYK